MRDSLCAVRVVMFILMVYPHHSNNDHRDLKPENVMFLRWMPHIPGHTLLKPGAAADRDVIYRSEL